MRATLWSIACFGLGLSSLLFTVTHDWGWDVYGWVVMMVFLLCLQASAGYFVLGSKDAARPFSMVGLVYLASIPLTLAAAFWAFEHASGC